MNRTLLPVLFVFVSAVSLSADPGFVSAKNGLNIRDKANSQAKVLGLAPFQAQIEVDEVTGTKEKIGGVEAPWMKVTYYNPETDSTIDGYAFGAFIFTEKGLQTPELREKFITKTHNLVVRHEKKDDTRWKVSLRLKTGTFAVIFENNGVEDKGPDDLYPSEYFPDVAFVLFRHSGMPDSYLVDLTTGKVHALDYGSPAASPKGTALYDIATGGMYGVSITIYELKGRVLVKVFSLGDSAAESWDRFRCTWKDEGSVVCRYAKDAAAKSFQIRKIGGKWTRSGG